MKKSLCVMLVLFLFLSIAVLPRASASENHCALFEDAINLLRWDLPWDVAEGDAFPVVSIMAYTRQLMCRDEYGQNPITEDGYSFYAYYAVPADVFEAAAKDFFGIVDVNALRSYTGFFWDYAHETGIDNFQHYQSNRQVYIFSSNGGKGDPSWYEVLGYTEEDGVYTVYSRFLSLIWDSQTPVGVEGVDYIRIGDEYFEILHYLRNVMVISNDRAQFHSWEEIKQLPDVELTTPSGFVFESEHITMEAPSGVFPANTTVEVRAVGAQQLPLVTDALGDVTAHFVAYDITASAQPNGEVLVSFAIPEGYDLEKLALFYIAEDGTAQQLEAVVNAEEGTITASLTHFSLYAVAQLADEDILLGDVNQDGKVNSRDARMILRYIAGLLEGETLDTKLADFNKDGQINSRDVRAILVHIAGLA